MKTVKETETVTFTGGYGSDYGDMTLWVENFSIGSKASVIEKSENGECEITEGAVVENISRRKYRNEDDYWEAVDSVMGDGDTTGEFVTDDDRIYVVIIKHLKVVKTKNIVYDNVYFS